MNHAEAIREMAVEQYLLGELSGASLEGFEEHLFDCPECAAELKAGYLFVEAARTELREPARASLPVINKVQSWTSWFTNPWVLAPALAACLLVIAIQTLVVVPRMKQELAQAQTPAVLNNLVLANAGGRGDSVAEIAAPQHGSFLLSVDIPARSGFTSYECSLFAPSGSLVWQTAVSPQQTSDALLIHIPTDKTDAGLNTLLVQGLPAGDKPNGKLVDLARYSFRLRLQK
ncbi:MAG: hypothetical protein JWM43_2441 [Acidobacteriaceae bacterium]|nr:hypothetical protein [Acidobacteriaceae bacterium]